MRGSQVPDNRLTSYRVGRDYFVAVVKLASGRVKVNDDEEIEGIDLRSPSEVGCFPRDAEEARARVESANGDRRRGMAREASHLVDACLSRPTASTSEVGSCAHLVYRLTEAVRHIETFRFLLNPWSTLAGLPRGSGSPRAAGAEAEGSRGSPSSPSRAHCGVGRRARVCHTAGMHRGGRRSRGLCPCQKRRTSLSGFLKDA